MRIAGLLALGLLLGSCAKSFDDWQQDLRDPDPYVRLMATVALGRSGRVEAAPDLLRALSDGNSRVRAAALESLRALGTQAIPALLSQLELGAAPADAPPGENASVASVLLELGSPGLAPLVSALQDPRYDRDAIVSALRESGPGVVDPLGELLLQPEPGLAAASAHALGELGEHALPAVTPLLLALRRTEPTVVAAAAGALARIGPERDDVLPALLQVARAPDGDATARDAALEGAVVGLLRHMASGEPARQEQALAQMADLGLSALDGLVHALKFEDDAVAAEAAACLATLGPAILPSVLTPLGERNPKHIERGALVVSRMGAPALAPLLAMLTDPTHPGRVRAATALAGLGDDAGPAWPALLAALDDPQPTLPIAAALTLGKLLPPDEPSLQALLAAHARKDAIVRRLLLPAAVRGVLARWPPDAGDASMRLEQLRALGPEAVTELGGLLASDDAQLAAAARRALDALQAR